MQTKGTKQICDNRQARHEYFILERYEAGIALQGNEVKSIRLGHVNLKDAWCDITDPLRERRAFPHRSYACPEASDASSGDSAAVRQGQAGRTDTCPPLSVFQGFQSEGAGGSLQGQKAL